MWAVVREVHLSLWEATVVLDRALQALRLVMVVEEAQDRDLAAQAAHFVDQQKVEARRISVRRPSLLQWVSLLVGEEEGAQQQAHSHAQACLHRRWVEERGMLALVGRVLAVGRASRSWPQTFSAREVVVVRFVLLQGAEEALLILPR